MSVVTEKRSGRRLPAVPRKPVNAVPRSQVERLWLVGGGTIALLLTVVAYFFFISPQRSETDDVRGRVDDTRNQNSALQGRLEQLKQQNQSLDKYRQELAAAQAALPSAANVSDFLRSLQALGSQTQTNVISLAVSAPVNVSISATGQAAPGAAVAAPSASPSASASTAPAAPGSAPSAGGAVPPGSVFSLPIKAEVSGSPGNLIKFIDQLQNVQPRAVLITSLVQTTSATTGTANSQTPGTVLDLTMQAFVTAPVVSAPSAAASTGPAK